MTVEVEEGGGGRRMLHFSFGKGFVTMLKRN